MEEPRYPADRTEKSRLVHEDYTWQHPILEMRTIIKDDTFIMTGVAESGVSVFPFRRCRRRGQ